MADAEKPRHCGYNTCAGDVTCECGCAGCIEACKVFADAVLRKGTVRVGGITPGEGTG